MISVGAFGVESFPKVYWSNCLASPTRSRFDQPRHNFFSQSCSCRTPTNCSSSTRSRDSQCTRFGRHSCRRSSQSCHCHRSCSSADPLLGIRARLAPLGRCGRIADVVTHGRRHVGIVIAVLRDPGDTWSLATQELNERGRLVANLTIGVVILGDSGTMGLTVVIGLPSAS